MKKIFIVILALALLSGCKKDEESKTTYRIINNATKNISSINYLDGTMWEVVVFCYKGTDIVRQDNFTSIVYEGGKSIATEVDPTFEKIKVSFRMLPPASEYYSNSLNNRIYTLSYFILEKGNNKDIIIDNNTMLTTSVNKSPNAFKSAIQMFK